MPRKWPRWIRIRDIAPEVGKSTEATLKWFRRLHIAVRYQGHWVSNAALIRDALPELARQMFEDEPDDT